MRENTLKWTQRIGVISILLDSMVAFLFSFISQSHYGLYSMFRRKECVCARGVFNLLNCPFWDHWIRNHSVNMFVYSFQWVCSIVQSHCCIDNLRVKVPVKKTQSRNLKCQLKWLLLSIVWLRFASKIVIEISFNWIFHLIKRNAKNNLVPLFNCNSVVIRNHRALLVSLAQN